MQLHQTNLQPINNTTDTHFAYQIKSQQVTNLQGQEFVSDENFEIITKNYISTHQNLRKHT